MKILKILLACALLYPLPLRAAAPGSAGGPGNVVVLTLPDGSAVRAELALTPQAQAMGLMNRESLAEDAGMLFVFREEAPRTFWMKNTFVSLDIVFLDKDMTVRNVFHRVPRSAKDQPEEEVARVSAQAMFVLELPAGKARKSGLKPGRKVKGYAAGALQPGRAGKKK